MKKLLRLNIVFLLLTIGSTSYAQWYGVSSGFNSSNIVYLDNTGTEIDLFSETPGFQIGLVTEIPVFKRLSLESCLLFSTKGYKEFYNRTYNGDFLEYNITANFNYIDIPFTTKVSFNLGRTKFYGALGPYLGIVQKPDGLTIFGQLN